MKTALAFLAAAVAAEAFLAPSSFAGHALSRAPTASSSAIKMAATTDPAFSTIDEMEKAVAPAGGGFWFGSAGFWGEEDYRGFVDSYKPDNLINGVYPLIDRVRATKILTTTSEAGLLSALEDAGLTLSETEKLLPALEEAGLLSFVADNGAVLINLFGFLAIEPAKLAIPAVVSLVKALKGLGLLNLAGGDAAPVPSKPSPVKAMKSAVKSAPVAAKKASGAVAQKSPVKPAAVMKAASRPQAAVKAAAPKVKAAAFKADAKAKTAVKQADSKVKATVKKAAPKVVAAAKKADIKAKSTVIPAAEKAVATAKKTVSSVSKGNISNLPKAL